MNSHSKLIHHQPCNKFNDSVQDLDELLDDLNTEQKQSNQKLAYEKKYHNSTSSLNFAKQPMATQAGSRQYYASSQQLNTAKQVDECTLRLQEEMERAMDAPASPRGVFVKDVVEEEIFVDHVQPVYRNQDQQKTSKTVTRTKTTTTTSKSQHANYSDDDEVYDNEHQHQVADRVRNQHSASMGSLNSDDDDSHMSDDQLSLGGSSYMLEPSAVVNCHVCNERVYGEVFTALNRSYHKHHFTCAHCKQELGTKIFYERDNLPYCEADYGALFSPKCAACLAPILNKVTIALNKTFHPEHFVCAHCGCQFDEEHGFHEKNGLAYCKDDFFELFASKCAGCHLPITANYLTALNKQWHPNCLTCSDCHCPFAGGKYFDIDDEPYCEIHYHARRGSLCAACKQPVIGKCTTAMFRKFHTDHFTCTYCLKVLNKTFKEEADKPYCHGCFDKLFS